MSWYKDNPKNQIDGRLAYESAGAMGRGVAQMGAVASDYARLKYKKKRDKKDDENLVAQNDTNIKTHKIDYAKSTDTATINSTGKVKAAKVNANADKYVIDTKKGIAKIDYAKSTDTATINSTGKVKAAQISGKAKVTSASIGANAKKYSANVSATNNKRTNATSAENSKRSSKTQKFVSTVNYAGAKLKVDSKKNKPKRNLKLEALKRAKTPEERLKILNSKNIGDVEI